MAYATYADLIAAHDEQYLIQLTDSDNNGIADPEKIAQAIEAAEADINARISSRYAVPLNPVPALAKAHAAILAISLLYSRNGQDKPQSVIDDVKAVHKLLDRIGEGKATWGEATEPVADTATLDVRMTSKPRVMNRDTLRGF